MDEKKFSLEKINEDKEVKISTLVIIRLSITFISVLYYAYKVISDIKI